MSPFEADLGYNPRVPVDELAHSLDPVQARDMVRSLQGREFAISMKNIFTQAADDLEAAQDAQKAAANRKRSDHDFVAW
jgi:hypothetical protein